MNKLFYDKQAAGTLYLGLASSVAGRNITVYFWQPTMSDLGVALLRIDEFTGDGTDIHDYMGLRDLRGIQSIQPMAGSIQLGLNQLTSLGLISSYNVVTSPIVNGGLADITIGISYLPKLDVDGATITYPGVDNVLDSGTESAMFFSADMLSQAYATPNYKNWLALHELGHSMGLDDAFKVGGVYDNLKYSAMSYNGHAAFGSFSPDSFMLLDYLAFSEQGLLKSFNPKDAYFWNSNERVLHTIYDTAGVNSISAAGHQRNTIIDLREGHFSSYGATDTGSEAPVENLAIAYGTIIQNAIGSDNDDVLIGNENGNELTGGKGNDFIYGNGTNYDTTDWNFSNAHKTAYAATVDASNNNIDDKDTIYGGEGNDFIKGESGNDTLYGDDGEDTIFGDMGDDSIEGGKDSDYIYGDYKEFSVVGGKDTIDGGEGDDILEGGTGNDTYKFSGDFGHDIINDVDGLGSIELSGMSGSFTSLYGSKEIYRDASKTYEAVKIDNGGSTDLLIISLAGVTTGSVLIKKWKEGDLGISLIDTPANTGGGGGGGNTIFGNGSNNAITLDNLRDNNPGLDVSTIGNLYADGGAGNDFIMGMLNGADTLLGGEGNDIISGGFTSQLGENALKTMGSTGGADSIDGGGGNDFIFAAAGGGMVHGGKDNDVLLATGPAYFQFNNIKKLDASIPNEIAGHPDITRDEVLADMMSSINFSASKSGSIYTYNTSYFQGLPTEFAEYNSTVQDVKYIGKSGGGSSNYNNGDVSYGFSGSYTFTYDYSNKDDELTPVGSAGSPVIVATSTFTSSAGSSSDTKKGANLFGDEGDDFLVGGIYSDYLSGGTENDGIFGGAGNDVLDGGTGNDFLGGQEGKDILLGGDGNDTLDGGDGNNFLIGGKGADHFIGGKDDDIFVAAFDDVSISGGGGNNIYIVGDIVIREADLAAQSNNNNNNAYVSTSSAFVEAPETQITSSLLIDGAEGNNTLALVGVSSLDQLSLTAQGNDLLLRAGNAQFLIRDGANGTLDHIAIGDSVEQFTLSATSTASTTFDDFMLTNLTSSIDRTAQVAGTQITGGLLNDTLTAHVGGSTMLGGGDDDVLLGNLGDDTYVIRKNDGNDAITEKGGNNTIKLGQDFSVNQLNAHRSGADFIITISNEQSVTVKNMFDATTGGLVAANSIQQIQFYDGAVLTLAQLQQLAIAGTAADDIIGAYNTADLINGGLGNDKLAGGAGDDVYKYAVGDGNDVITDTSGNDRIELGAGILQNDVTAIRDGYNNLVLRFSNGGSIAVNGAFDAAGNFTANAIETISFADNSTWDMTRIKTEVENEAGQLITGTLNDDALLGSTGKDIFNAGKGNDQTSGSVGNDIYKYALGDGKDIVIDKGGNDRIEFQSGITQSNVVATSNGVDLVLTLSDGGSITVKNMFVTPTQTTVDPLITAIIEQLQSNWMSQSEALIESHYGLTGSGNITLGFIHEGKGGSEAAHVEVVTSTDPNTPKHLSLVIDLDDFAGTSPNGSGPVFNDRVIAHEMVHAVMALNMDTGNLPGWFTEGTAEFIHGADERVRGDLSIINNLNNFNVLFKTTAGSPSQSAGYSVSYIAVKILDSEIRAQGGVGIKELFAELKAGKTLDQSLSAVSLAHGGMGGKWNNLVSFEAHIKADGFNMADSILNLTNPDTGSIMGSDYGGVSLDASTVLSNVKTGPSKYFNLIIPQEFIANDTVESAIETIKFADNSTWDLARIQQEILKGQRVGTDGNDTILGSDGKETIIGKKGHDKLYGGRGDDHYLYSVGDGEDFISDTSGFDTLEFGAGVNSADVTVRRLYGSTSMSIRVSSGSSVFIEKQFNSAQPDTGTLAIDAVKFSNGEIWDGYRLKQEMLKATSASDDIRGFDVNDLLDGGLGNDTLAGISGDDIYIGGLGNDFLYGGIGNDVYKYNQGDGDDRIEDVGGVDQVTFGAGILPTDISLQQFNDDIIFKLSTGGKITAQAMFNRSQGTMGVGAIESVKFNNGVVWDLDKIKQELLKGNDENNVIYGFNTPDFIDGGLGNDIISGSLGNDTLLGNAGNDSITSGDGDDILNGGAGKDSLYGGIGNDSLSGGGGFDSLQGGLGDDTYNINLHDSYQWITEESGNDTIRFGSGINPVDIMVVQNQGHLFFISESGQIIQVVYGADQSQPLNSIENVVFENGEIWDSVKLQQKIIDTSLLPNVVVPKNNEGSLIAPILGDFFIAGMNSFSINIGSGNNTIVSSYGETTYELDRLRTESSNKFHISPGKKIIRYYSIENDSLVFPDGTTINNLNFSMTKRSQVTQAVDAVSLTISSADGSFVVDLRGPGYVEYGSVLIAASATALDKKSMFFADGTSISFRELIEQRYYQGTFEADNITIITQQDQLVNSGNGNDSITGGFGNDTLISGDGNDTIYSGGFAYDILGGAGEDFLIGGAGNDSLRGSAGDSYIYNLGDGDDTISNINSDYPRSWQFSDKLSRVKLGEGIAPSDVSLVREGSNIAIKIRQGGSLTIVGAVDAQQKYSNVTGSYVDALTLDTSNIIQLVEFSDNTVWTALDLLDKLSFSVDNIAPPPLYWDTQFSPTGSSLKGRSPEVGARIIVKNADNSSILGSTFADNTRGQFIIDFAVPFANNELINIYAVDSVGNISAPFSLNAPDLTAPLKPIAIFDSTGKIISGQSEANSSITVRNSTNTTVLASGFADSAGNFSVTLSKALINNEIVNVTSTDQMGNISVPLDIKAPDKTPPTLTSAAFDTTYGFVKGSAEAGSTITVKRGSVVLATGVTDANGSYNVALPAPLINKEVITISAADAAGNVATTTKTLTAPDKTPPALPTATFDAAGKVITGVAEAGSTVTVKNSANTTTLGTATANATTGAYTITLTTALINKEIVNVTAKDAAGNVSAVKAIVAPDKTAPSLPTAAFDTAGKVITGVAEAGSTVVVKNSANTTTLGTVTANATTGAYSITLTTALINKETVNVTAKDAAGNVSAVKAIIAPDKTAPALPTAAFDTAGKVITGVAEAGSTVVVKNSGNTTTLGTVTANATTGAYTITLTTALINKETVNVTAKDVAGNISAVKAIIAPDKTAPALPTGAFNTAGKIITGVAEAGSTVVVKNSGNTTTLGTVTANATTGAYSVTLATALTNGQTVNITAKDVAGNVSAAKAIIAPKLAAALASQSFMSQKSVDATHQLDSMIQAMAAFAPPSAAESKVLVGVYDMTQPILASQA